MAQPTIFALAEEIIANSEILGDDLTVIQLKILADIFSEMKEDLERILEEFEDLYPENTKLIENQKDWVYFIHCVSEKLKNRNFYTDDDNPQYDNGEG